MKSEIELLTTDTITAMLSIYGLTYQHLALRLRCTRQGISYKQKANSWKQWELEVVLELLQQHGMEYTELLLIHHMTEKKNLTKDVNL